MIYIINYFKADPAKRKEAWDFLKRLAVFNREHGVGCEVMWNMTGGMRGIGRPKDILRRLAENEEHSPVDEPLWTTTGEPGEMMLLHTYKSLEHWGEYIEFVLADPEHKALMAEFKERGYFPFGHTRHVWGVADQEA